MGTPLHRRVGASTDFATVLAALRNSPATGTARSREREGEGDANEANARPGARRREPLDVSAWDADSTRALRGAPLLPIGAAPMCQVSMAPSAAPEARPVHSIETLLPEFVRRIAWSGDRSNGAVDLELGRGALLGARLLLTTEGGVVRARLEAPPGVDGEAWADRLRARLTARGIEVGAFDVRDGSRP